MDFWTPNSPLGGLPFAKDGVSGRSSSWDRTGGNRDFVQIEPGAEYTLADLSGPGKVEHIWMTVRCYSPQFLRKLVLEMYWDGEENPSVLSPLGDFFCVGHAVAVHHVSLPVSTIFGPRRGPNGPFSAAMNVYFPMPFAEGARIVLRNESDGRVENLFFYVDYSQAPCPPPEDAGRFHALYRQEMPTSKRVYPAPAGEPTPWDLPGKNLDGRDNYVILDTVGRGQFVGCCLSIENWDVSNQVFPWPGEGDDMFFIDGQEWPPNLHGTGTEDYFNCAWGFPSGAYAGPYHGISLASDVDSYAGLWTAYRFHIEDPVRYTESLLFSIEHGHANDQQNDYSSVAYWYQVDGETPRNELPPVESRLPRQWPEHGLWNR